MAEPRGRGNACGKAGAGLVWKSGGGDGGAGVEIQVGREMGPTEWGGL